MNRLLGILISIGLVATMTPQVWGVNPTGYGQAGGEFDITISRVPKSGRAKAKRMKPPFKATPEILAEGKENFSGCGRLCELSWTRREG